MPSATARDAPLPFGACAPPLRLRLMQRVITDRRLSTAIRAALRHRLKPLMPRRPVDVTVEGVKFRCRPDDNKVDFDLVAKRRLDEAAERAFLAERLRPGDVFVDIGANIGLYTLSVLLRGPNGIRVVAFEPHAGLRGRLAFNLAANGVADRATVLPWAVGPRPATMTLWSNAAGNSGRSSLVAFDGDRRAGAPVEVRPLTAILAEGLAPRIDLLKIDVEGFEDAALMPFFDAAPDSAWPRAMVIETLHRDVWRRDCLAELARLGYERYGETCENVLLRRERTS